MNRRQAGVLLALAPMLLCAPQVQAGFTFLSGDPETHQSEPVVVGYDLYWWDLGDLNADGYFDEDELYPFLAVYTLDATLFAPDYTGAVSDGDFSVWGIGLDDPLLAAGDEDEVDVDVGDFTLWGDPFDFEYDRSHIAFNGDDAVDIGDSSQQGSFFGWGSTLPGAAPEPASALLLAVGALCLLAARHPLRRRGSG